MGVQDQIAPWLVPLLAAILIGSAVVWRAIVGRIQRGRSVLRRRRRRPVPWGPGGAILAAYCVVNGLLVLVVQASTEADAVAEPSDEAGLSLAMAAAYAALSALLSGVAILGLRTQGATPADFGWSYRNTEKSTSTRQFAGDLGVGLACFLAMLPVVYAVQIVIVGLLRLPSGHPSVERLMNGLTGEGVLAVFLMAVVVAPLFEELAFRVLLQGWLERVAGSRRAWWPIILSSIAFAAAHTGQGYAPIPIFVLSLGIGYVYRQRHRYAACVAAHAAFNGLSLVAVSGMV